MSANHRKLKIAVLAGMLAFSVTGTALATPGSHHVTSNIGSIDLSKEFTLDISPCMVGWSDRDYYTYLYYTPVDKDVVVPHGFDDPVTVTYKGGILYLVKGKEIGDADSGNSISDISATALGNAQDIFGEGITEEEIKDLIVNVEGDQTVDGNQTVTGSQDVQGGQTVSGGLHSFSKQAYNSKNINIICFAGSPMLPGRSGFPARRL